MFSETQYDERAILQKVATGDEAAFRQLYDHHRQRIYSFAVQLTKSEDRGDEIVQEVFMRVWTYRASLSEVQNFQAWIQRIARNLFIDALRKIAREKDYIREIRPITSEEHRPVEDALRDKELAGLMQKALEELTPQQRTIFELSRIQGLKREEIARQLNLSENTVKVHLTRALSTIRDYLGRHSGSALSLIILLFISEGG